MIHIAICDDDLRTGKKMEQYITCWKENQDIEVDVFTSGKAFEEELKETYYDMVLLDIVLSDISGIELGRKIREELKNDSSLIIYMSAYSEYAMELFQYQPFHYLKKPIEPAAFRKVFYLACDRIKKNTGIFEFKFGRSIRRVPFSKICYFEGDNRRVRIVTDSNVFYCYSTIEKLFSKINMEKEDFIRIHKSYAVNANYVSSFTTKKVFMFDGTELTVSAQFRENAQKWYGAYVERIGW